MDKNDVESWTLTRDLTKLMDTKLYYTGQNVTIHNNPVVHAQAILDCVQAERCSKKLEHLLSLRVRMLQKQYNCTSSQAALQFAASQLRCSYKQYYLSDASDDYLYEDQINEMLGLDFITYFDIVVENTYNLE